ncbi:hypothetical protein H6G00_00790 [Leptolyngbya sp. FACHB-541]|uniref:hypothetical protein n=1 Tax=Leptolyngbya sp. FACHB-541 TaxID=2692810 RepID=UPI0016847D22|nr:hypothetical protein [Leptolyngbya sp. FACHB-541]MBD1995164.1 hypothetical protein [Leptolyngbya sp. FACHB-541]
MTYSIRQATTVVVKPVTVNAVVSQPSQVTAVRVNAGLPGRSGSGGGSIKIPFSWGDASPKAVYEVEGNGTVFRASIVIQTPFDGVGASLRLGDGEVGDRLIRADQNLPSQAGEYATSPGITYMTSTFILLEITPGEGNQGSGFVLLEI